MIVLPVVIPLSVNNTLASEDEEEGTIITVEDGTLNFEVIIVVNSDPCPSVQWSFEGLITFTDQYSIPGTSSPYTFTFTIASITAATSGRYSVLFTNLAGSVPFPVVITIPGKKEGTIIIKCTTMIAYFFSGNQSRLILPLAFCLEAMFY